MNPKDKVALITGGARMGQAVALKLAQEGCHIVLTYRHSKKNAEESARDIRLRNRRALAIQADLAEEKDIARVIRQVKKQFGRLDILVNMASIYEKTPISKLSSRQWDENMNANLKNAYLLSLQAAPLMKKGGEGRIINFSDWISRSGRPRYRDYLPYYISKIGVLGLTEALALELAPEILVNSIAPGPILPPEGLKRSEYQKVIQATPLRKWGGALEIAKAVLFLVETDFVTGECIRVDGGRHLY